MVKHVVGYSLSMCEFVCTLESEECLFESDGDQVYVTVTFLSSGSMFFVIQGSRSSQMKMSNVWF